MDISLWAKRMQLDDKKSLPPALNKPSSSMEKSKWKSMKTFSTDTFPHLNHVEDVHNYTTDSYESTNWRIRPETRTTQFLASQRIPIKINRPENGSSSNCHTYNNTQVRKKNPNSFKKKKQLTIEGTNGNSNSNSNGQCEISTPAASTTTTTTTATSNTVTTPPAIVNITADHFSKSTISKHSQPSVVQDLHEQPMSWAAKVKHSLPQDLPAQKSHTNSTTNTNASAMVQTNQPVVTSLSPGFYTEHTSSAASKLDKDSYKNRVLQNIQPRDTTGGYCKGLSNHGKIALGYSSRREGLSTNSMARRQYATATTTSSPTNSTMIPGSTSAAQRNGFTKRRRHHHLRSFSVDSYPPFKWHERLYSDALSVKSESISGSCKNRTQSMSFKHHLHLRHNHNATISTSSSTATSNQSEEGNESPNELNGHVSTGYKSLRRCHSDLDNTIVSKSKYESMGNYNNNVHMLTRTFRGVAKANDMEQLGLLSCSTCIHFKQLLIRNCCLNDENGLLATLHRLDEYYQTDLSALDEICSVDSNTDTTASSSSMSSQSSLTSANTNRLLHTNSSIVTATSIDDVTTSYRHHHVAALTNQSVPGSNTALHHSTNNNQYYHGSSHSNNSSPHSKSSSSQHSPPMSECKKTRSRSSTTTSSIASDSGEYTLDSNAFFVNHCMMETPIDSEACVESMEFNSEGATVNTAHANITTCTTNHSTTTSTSPQRHVTSINTIHNSNTLYLNTHDSADDVCERMVELSAKLQSRRENEECNALTWSVQQAARRGVIDVQLERSLYTSIRQGKWEEARDVLYHKCHLIPAVHSISNPMMTTAITSIANHDNGVMVAAGGMDMNYAAATNINHGHYNEMRQEVNTSSYSTSTIPASIVANNNTDEYNFEMQSNKSFLKYINTAAPIESVEAQNHKKHIAQLLSNIITKWVKIVAMNRQLSPEYIALTNGSLYLAGSYRLGLHDPNSDIDTVCVVPYHVTVDDFFTSFVNILSETSGVLHIAPVPNAYVPLISLIFHEVHLDVLFARLPRMFQITNHQEIDSDHILHHLDVNSMKSLNAPRVSSLILNLVPHRDVYRIVLRAVRHWAKKRGIYSSKLGYLGGVSYAILTAFVCQLYPNANANIVFLRFFQILSEWQWPQPIVLNRIYDAGMGFDMWDPRTNRYDRSHLMPIITPAYPPMNSATQVSQCTFQILYEELYRARYLVEQSMGICSIPMMTMVERNRFHNSQYAGQYSNNTMDIQHYDSFGTTTNNSAASRSSHFNNSNTMNGVVESAKADTFTTNMKHGPIVSSSVIVPTATTADNGEEEDAGNGTGDTELNCVINNWSTVFEESKFFVRFASYIMISFSAASLSGMDVWGKFVQSRIRKLVENLQHVSCVPRVYAFPQFFPYTSLPSSNSASSDAGGQCSWKSTSLGECVFIGLETACPLKPISISTTNSTSSAIFTSNTNSSNNSSTNSNGKVDAGVNVMKSIESTIRFFEATELLQFDCRKESMQVDFKVLLWEELPDFVFESSKSTKLSAMEEHIHIMNGGNALGVDMSHIPQYKPYPYYSRNTNHTPGRTRYRSRSHGCRNGTSNYNRRY